MTNNGRNGKKANRVEVDRRVNQVFNLLIDGVGSEIIVQYCSEHFDVTDRTGYKYIARARDRITEAAKFKREYEFGRSLYRLNAIYRSEKARVVRDGKGKPILDDNGQQILNPNYHGMRETMKEMHKILGFHTSTVHLELDWTVQLQVDVQEGIVNFEMVERMYGDELATKLFREAGIPVKATGGDSRLLE